MNDYVWNQMKFWPFSFVLLVVLYVLALMIGFTSASILQETKLIPQWAGHTPLHYTIPVLVASIILLGTFVYCLWKTKERFEWFWFMFFAPCKILGIVLFGLWQHRRLGVISRAFHDCLVHRFWLPPGLYTLGERARPNQ